MWKNNQLQTKNIYSKESFLDMISMPNIPIWIWIVPFIMEKLSDIRYHVKHDNHKTDIRKAQIK